MNNLHFARILQNDIVIISDMLRCVKLKLSHFAKYMQNDYIKKSRRKTAAAWWGVGGSNPFGVKCQSDVLIQKSYRVLGPAQVTPLTPFPTTANTFFMQSTSLK